MTPATPTRPERWMIVRRSRTILGGYRVVCSRELTALRVSALGHEVPS